VDAFPEASSNTIFQFSNGLGNDLFPTDTNNNFSPQTSTSFLTAFQDVLQKFEILVPETFMGKSLAEIANEKTPPPVAPKKKAFKCYRIDPQKDIVDDQILVDPTSGESLRDTMKTEASANAGGDPLLLGQIPLDTSGIMPGDIQDAISIFFIVVGSITLASYLGYIVVLVMRKEMNSAAINFGIFLMLFIGLILLGVYYGEHK
jgi:hypothetical protein